MKKYLSNPVYAILIALFSCILWGSAFPVLKISFDELGIAANDIYTKLAFAGARFLLASIFLFILLKFVMQYPLKISNNKILLELIVLGIVQTTLQYFFFYNGLAHTSGAKGAIIMASQTLFVVLLAHFIYSDDKMNWRKILGLIVGFTGIILVNWGKEGLNLEFTFIGEGFLILAALAGAIGNILSKKYATHIHPFFLTAWQMLLGSFLLLGFGAVGLHKNNMNFTIKAVILFVYSAFLSATAFSLWNSLLKYHKAGEISMFRFMIPVSGAILSVVFIPDENLTIHLFCALVLVSLGIISVYYQKQKN
ncbi:MAG: hypothetical protein PWP27_1968 [Clostridiales bacterium]|jgi:drug/metabolite transporter (DMT)-like permease|nr:hypothetical protein [Clostridiales bacterium]MDK2934158.1 hypothetical protein [Clostridiales bacterium]